MLKFEDEIEKRTQYTLEMIGSTETLFEQTNSPELHALLTDVETALEEAELTELQRELIYAYYFKGFDTVEIGEYRGISKQAVNKSMKSSVKKIAKVFEEWDYWSEGESYVPRIY